MTGGSRAQLSRGLITFAQHWMVFAKQRCERGRGLRPRWAHHGFDFLMTICEPHFTNCLTDEEFEVILMLLHKLCNSIQFYKINLCNFDL